MRKSNNAVVPKSGFLFSRQPLTKRAATRCDEVAEMQRLVDAGASLTAGVFTPLFGAAEFGQVRWSAIIVSESARMPTQGNP